MRHVICNDLVHEVVDESSVAELLVLHAELAPDHGMKLDSGFVSEREPVPSAVKLSNLHEFVFGVVLEIERVSEP